jgi:Asp-tRNA(Asn)/Glu-tRNA(Gln) amidotransferase A subunit family amidase
MSHARSSSCGSSLRAVARALREGDATASETLHQVLDRLAALGPEDPGAGAVLTLDPHAPERAARLDDVRRRAGRAVGPLHGVPIVVKDVFETAGVPTSFGCAAFARYVPGRDAEAVRRLKAAGAVVVGKASTPDFAMSWLSDTSARTAPANARSSELDAGGSSSGSAVAVAAALVPAALGSDTGGSVRVPAAFNGVVGFRPSHRMVPTTGMSPLVPTQDTPAPLASTVADVALLHAVLAGQRLGSRERPPSALRIGLLRNDFRPSRWPGAPEVRAAVDYAVAVLADAGVAMVDVVIDDLDRLLSDGSSYRVSSRAAIDQFLGCRPALGAPRFLDLYDAGVFPESLDLASMIAGRSDADPGRWAVVARANHTLRGRIAHLIDAHGLDAVLYPTVRVAAPPRDRDRMLLPDTSLPVNTRIAAQAGLPALALPPGMELLGRRGRDADLLEVGEAVERMISGV